MTYSIKYKSGSSWVDFSDHVTTLSGIEIRYDDSGNIVLQEPYMEVLINLPDKTEIKIYDSLNKSIGHYDLYRKEFDYESRLYRCNLTDILKRLETKGLDFSNEYVSACGINNTSNPKIDLIDNFGFPSFSDITPGTNGIIRLIPWLQYTLSSIMTDISPGNRFQCVDVSNLTNETPLLDFTAFLLSADHEKEVRNLSGIPFNFVCFSPLQGKAPLDFLSDVIRFFGIGIKYYNDKYVLTYRFNKPLINVSEDLIFSHEIENNTDVNELSLRHINSEDKSNLFYPEDTLSRQKDISSEISFIPFGSYPIASNQYPYYLYLQNPVFDSQYYGRLCAILPGTFQMLEQYFRMLVQENFDKDFPPKKWGERKGVLANPTNFNSLTSYWEQYEYFANANYEKCASILCGVPESKDDWLISETFLLRKDYNYQIALNLVTTEPDSPNYRSLQEHDYIPITQIFIVLSDPLPVPDPVDETDNETIDTTSPDEESYYNIIPQDETLEESLLKISDPELSLVSGGSYIGTQMLTISYSPTSGISNYSVRYTIDGTEPTEESSLYTAPVSVSAYVLIKVKIFGTDTTHDNIRVSSKTITENYSVYQFRNTRIIKTLDYRDQITYNEGNPLVISLPESLYSGLNEGRYKIAVYVKKEYYYETANDPVRIHLDHFRVYTIDENTPVTSYLEPDGTFDVGSNPPFIGLYSNQYERFTLKIKSSWQLYWLYILYHYYYGAQDHIDQFNRLHKTRYKKKSYNTLLYSWDQDSIPDVLTMNFEDQENHIEERY